MIAWPKVGDNKRKLHKNFGIQHGFIKGKFKGKSEDFDDFIKEVVIKTHNYGFGLNFGKSIYKQHKSLIKKMDGDYFSGVKLGLDQALTEENHYRDYQIELFGPSGMLLSIKEEDEEDEEVAKETTNTNWLLRSTNSLPTLAEEEHEEKSGSIESAKNKISPVTVLIYFFFSIVILIYCTMFLEEFFGIYI